MCSIYSGIMVAEGAIWRMRFELEPPYVSLSWTLDTSPCLPVVPMSLLIGLNDKTIWSPYSRQEEMQAAWEGLVSQVGRSHGRMWSRGGV